MRIWHKDLISVLPRQQLLGQWRECCAIAKSIHEKGTPNHVLVNRVNDYPVLHFMIYVALIYREMLYRGYQPRLDWCDKYLPEVDIHEAETTFRIGLTDLKYCIFPGWHNDRYLRQCLANLQEKADCCAIPADEWAKITDKYSAYK